MPAQKAIQPHVAVGTDGPVVVWLEEVAGVWEVRVKAGGRATPGRRWAVPEPRARRTIPSVHGSRSIRRARRWWRGPSWHADNWNVYAKRWDGSAWTLVGREPTGRGRRTRRARVDVVSDGSRRVGRLGRALGWRHDIHVRVGTALGWVPVGRIGDRPRVGRRGTLDRARSRMATPWWRSPCGVTTRGRTCGWPLDGHPVGRAGRRGRRRRGPACGRPDRRRRRRRRPGRGLGGVVLGDQGKEDVKVHAKRWDGAAWVVLGGPLNVATPATSNAYHPSRRSTRRPAGGGVARGRGHRHPGVREALDGIGVGGHGWTDQRPLVRAGGRRGGEDGVVYVAWSEHVDETEDVFVKRFNELP
jgi:hypothetical protein